MRFHGRDLRRGRVSVPWQVYSITAVTLGRQPFFGDLYMARTMIGVLREHEAMAHADTLAYVLMPDHLHWLMSLRPGRSLSAVVRSVKAISSRRLGRRIWQKGFYDRAVRTEDDLRDLARYIVANPLRARLVRHIGEYPHWDAIWL
ncbi:MAG: transposase [Pseudomonadota bacterium]